MTDKKDNSKNISSTDQFYHSCIDRLSDTDTFSNRENDDRFRPLLIEHLKKRIAQGKFDVSREEVLKIIKKASKEITDNPDNPDNPDNDIKKKD